MKNTELWVIFLKARILCELHIAIFSFFIHIFMIALPVLAPFSIAMNAAGMLPKPSVTCSLHLSFPWNRTRRRDKDKKCYRHNKNE